MSNPLRPKVIQLYKQVHVFILLPSYIVIFVYNNQREIKGNALVFDSVSSRHYTAIELLSHFKVKWGVRTKKILTESDEGWTGTGKIVTINFGEMFFLVFNLGKDN